MKDLDIAVISAIAIREGAHLVAWSITVNQWPVCAEIELTNDWQIEIREMGTRELYSTHPGDDLIDAAKSLYQMSKDRQDNWQPDNNQETA